MIIAWSENPEKVVYGIIYQIGMWELSLYSTRKMRDRQAKREARTSRTPVLAFEIPLQELINRSQLVVCGMEDKPITKRTLDELRIRTKRRS